MDEQKQSDNKTVLSLRNIIPAIGTVSYELFCLNIVQPKRFSRFFGTRDLAAADFLWFNAHVGIGWYIYHRKHIQTLQTPWRVAYSVFGSGIFNFGTVLFWGTIKALVPKLPDAVKIVFGFSSGMLLLYLGKSYLDFVDSFVTSDDLSSSETD